MLPWRERHEVSSFCPALCVTWGIILDPLPSQACRQHLEEKAVAAGSDGDVRVTWDFMAQRIV